MSSIMASTASSTASPSDTASEVAGKRKVSLSPEDESKKRAKGDLDLRSWSTEGMSVSSAKVYTLKCYFGDPSKPLASRIKTQKIGVIKEFLQQRGVSTVGTKATLLERYRTELPYIRMEIDSRECLQRVIHGFLHYFGWDSTHLFEAKMPRRGSLKDGAKKLNECLGLDLMIGIKNGNVSANPDSYDKRMRNHMERKLQAAGMTWNDLAYAIQHPDELGPTRKLTGAAFDPYEKGMGSNYDDEAAAGGMFSMEELALQAGDKMNITYDYGDNHKFTVVVESLSAKDSLLPEMELGGGNPTRAKLLNKGNGTISPQYRGGFDY